MKSDFLRYIDSLPVNELWMYRKALQEAQDRYTKAAKEESESADCNADIVIKYINHARVMDQIALFINNIQAAYDLDKGFIASQQVETSTTYVVELIKPKELEESDGQ